MHIHAAPRWRRRKHHHNPPRPIFSLPSLSMFVQPVDAKGVAYIPVCKYNTIQLRQVYSEKLSGNSFSTFTQYVRIGLGICKLYKRKIVKLCNRNKHALSKPTTSFFSFCILYIVCRNCFYRIEFISGAYLLYNPTLRV